MSEKFINLTKENFPTGGKLNSGKIIKSDKVKIGSVPRLISTENDYKSNIENKNRKEKLPQNESIEENSFTFEPIYNEDVLIELGVGCACGNHSKIIFKKEEKDLAIENQNLSEIESEKEEKDLEQSEKEEKDLAIENQNLSEIESEKNEKDLEQSEN